MTESKEIIRVEKLNKYFGELHVLKDIDLTVYENDVVVLIGASGSGKSTLLRCMNYLEIKNDGDIIIDGSPVHPKRDQLNGMRQKIGMVFQHFNLFPHKTVLENIIEAPIMVKKTKKAMKSLAKEGMTMVIVTHEMGFAKEVADRVVYMHEGRIVEEGVPSELFDSPREKRTKLFLSSIL